MVIVAILLAWGGFMLVQGGMYMEGGLAIVVGVGLAIKSRRSRRRWK
jgi:hypothetical protein